MFSLFKLGIDVAMALLCFYGGMKAQQNFPNLIAKIESLGSWVKSLL